jgi:hypothetical protein
MDLAYQRKRLVDVARSVRLSKALAEQERWPRERLERHQRERIDALVRHAASESPFYKERFAGLLGAGPVELSELVADRGRRQPEGAASSASASSVRSTSASVV